MSQNSITIANGTGLQVRTGFNNSNNTLATKFSGATAPGTPVTYQSWIDTSVSPVLLKVYDGADWIVTASLDAATNSWIPYRSGTALGTMSTQSNTSVNIDGGTVDGTPIGSTTPSTGMFSTVDVSGDAVIGGNSTFNGNVSTHKLTATETGAGPAAVIRQEYPTGLANEALNLSKYDNVTTTSNVFMRFMINNAVSASGAIAANGSGQAAFISWSDERTKENISDLPSQLGKVCTLRPVEFDYTAEYGGGHQEGFIAQEVRDVYPDLVGEDADGMLTLGGLSKTDARLIKAIQEQQDIITALITRVEALEAK